MEIYLVTIKPNIVEAYNYAFKNEPIEEEYKKIFFDAWGDEYEQEEWKDFRIEIKKIKLRE